MNYIKVEETSFGKEKEKWVVNRREWEKDEVVEEDDERENQK